MQQVDGVVGTMFVQLAIAIGVDDVVNGKHAVEVEVDGEGGNKTSSHSQLTT